jgi:uncharacterized damage-inducible protein DinB
MKKIEKPKEAEYNSDIVPYINLIPDDGHIIKHLANNLKKTKSFLLSIPGKKFQYRYAENKWTIKDILAHIMDHERIYAYRALRIARNDKTPLPGYDADNYALYSRANERSLKEIFEEYDTVRNATISLFKSFDEAAFLRTGTAIGHTVSVRALAYHIAGHELHHMNIIKERYL